MGRRFEYSGLSIISLRKESPLKETYIRIIDSIPHPHVLNDLAVDSPPADLDCSVSQASQLEVCGNTHAVITRLSSEDLSLSH